MPSVHMGATAIIALVAWGTGRVAVRLGGVVYAAAMGFALVYLGEHYVVDLLAGMAVAAAAWCASRALWRRLEGRAAARDSGARQAQHRGRRLSGRGAPDATDRWCRGRDSNPHALRPRILSPLRLPVPPPRHRFGSGRSGECGEQFDAHRDAHQLLPSIAPSVADGRCRRLSGLAPARLNEEDVMTRLAELFVRRGMSVDIRADDGPEFTARAVGRWLKRLGVQLLFIEPGRPWEHGYVEPFNGKVRDECLNVERFGTLLEAQVLVERWRCEYNQLRPHSALGRPAAVTASTSTGRSAPSAPRCGPPSPALPAPSSHRAAGPARRPARRA